MKDWFENLAPREQLLVSLCAIVVSAALFYLIVWSPLSAANSRLTDSVESKRETLAELARWQGRITPPNQSRTASGSGQSLVILVSQTATTFELAGSLRSSQPVNSNSIRVQMEAAAFDTLVRWLGELEKRHGLAVRSASFTPAPQDGRVNSTLTLERA